MAMEYVDVVDDHHHHHPLHIAVFPWLAFGHMMPFLDLCKTLASKGHHISYLTTPTNISRLLSSSSSSTLSPLITFIPLPLPPTPNLPTLAGATSDVSPDQVQYLKLALDSLQLPLTTFLHEASPKPDWLLLDFATPWAIPIASSFSIPCAFFSIFTASFLTFLGPCSELTDHRGSRTSPENFTVKPNWIPFPSNLSYSLHGAKTLMAVYENNVSGITDISRYRKTVEGCKVIGLRTCMEVEGELVKLLGDLHDKPVLPLGFLRPATSHEDDEVKMDNNNNNINKEIFAWLDMQKSGSVVYVAFGSEATLSVELMHELALGLELSELPFLWVLREPLMLGTLPLGFEERVGGRGMVVKGWVDQVRVLGHGGVGGFLSHSGWSSIVEAVGYGHPLMLLPIYVDQEANARMVVAGGFGVEVRRREEDGYFGKEEVGRVLRLVMVDEEGDGVRVRVRAREMQKVFGDRVVQEKYVDDFLRFLKGNKGKLCV